MKWEKDARQQMLFCETYSWERCSKMEYKWKGCKQEEKTHDGCLGLVFSKIHCNWKPRLFDSSLQAPNLGSTDYFSNSISVGAGYFSNSLK